MNKFEKVSYEQFYDAMKQYCFSKEEIKRMYDEIIMPRRGTSGSAGYDFMSPVSFSIQPGEAITIPTGIRALLDDDKFLLCVPRSGLGFKYRLRLANTCGVIDSDYAQADNGGHIMAKLVNEGDKVVTVEQGKAFMQGIILPYIKVDDDDADGTRTGGFGSTDAN